MNPSPIFISLTRRRWCMLTLACAGFVLVGAWSVHAWNAHVAAAAAVPARPDLINQPSDFADQLMKSENSARGYFRPASGLAQLARLYHANGFFTEASMCYRGMITLEPHNAQWLHLLASILAGFGQLEEAIPLERRAASLVTNDIAINLRLGDMLLKTNQADQAVFPYRTVLQLNPDDAYALLGLARCDLAANNWKSARERLVHAVEKHPDFFGGWVLLATVTQHLGDSTAEIDARQRGNHLGRFRDFPDPWLDGLIENCYNPYQLSVAAAASADQTVARRLIERAVALAPDSSTYHQQFAKMLRAANEPTLARQQLEKAVAAAPKDSESWAGLIDLLINLRDPNAARTALVEALENCPESAYLHFINGERLASLGHPVEAETEFKIAKRLQPSEARAYIQLSMLYFQESRIDDAIAEVRAGQIVEPGNSLLLAMLARLAIMKNDEIAARHWISELKQKPDAAQQDDLATVEAQFRDVFGKNP